MSLRYKLFGIPASVEEVVDRAQRTGEIPEVYPNSKIVDGFDCSDTYSPQNSWHALKIRYEIIVRIGKTKVIDQQWERWFKNFVLGIDDKRYDFVSQGHLAHERAEDLAAQLSQKGIPVLYCVSRSGVPLLFISDEVDSKKNSKAYNLN